MLVLTSLEVYKSLFNITEEKNKFEFYDVLDSKVGGVSDEKVRDKIEKDLKSTNITATNLQDEILGPLNFEECVEQVSERMK